MNERDEAFARFLIDAGILSRAQVQSIAASAESAPLSRVLVESGALDAGDITRALGKYLNIPFISLAPETIAAEALFAIPEAYARAHNMVAYAKEGDELHVALVDIESEDALDNLQLPFRVKTYLTDRQSMKRALLRYQQALGELYALHARASSLPEQTVDSLLLHALSQQARAIHMDMREQGLVVRYRIRGVLHDALVLPAHAAAPIIERLKSLAKIATNMGEGRFTIAREGAERTAVMVTILPQTDSESLVLHFMPDVKEVSDRALSLGLHGDGLEHIHRALEKRSGLVLVCGHEESGVYALLRSLAGLAAQPGRSVVSVEDTGEAISLATLLRAALRHDPDVVVLSDVRDAQVAALAASAANRGVLVIAGLAARSAASGIEYLEALVPPRTLASVLLVAVSVQMVRALCKHNEQTKPTRSEIDALEARGASLSRVLGVLKKEGDIATDAQWKDVPFFKAMRCPECGGGYRGETMLVEVLPTSMALRRDIQEEAFAEVLAAQAYSEGMLSLLEDGVYKAALGQTTIDEVLQLEQ